MRAYSPVSSAGSDRSAWRQFTDPGEFLDEYFSKSVCDPESGRFVFVWSANGEPLQDFLIQEAKIHLALVKDLLDSDHSITWPASPSRTI